MVRKSRHDVTWGDYEVYDPGAFGPSNMLSRAEARRALNLLMEAKPRRIGMLRHLLSVNHVELSSADSAIQDLNDWFRLNVEADRNKPGRLTPDWYSVVNDIALFLGDVMIERCPGLRWEFYIWGTKIRGVEIDLDAVTTSADHLEIEAEAFCRWLKLAERQA